MNEYDRLTLSINEWTRYVDFHRRYARGRHMNKAWHNRMKKIDNLIKKLEKDRSLL